MQRIFFGILAFSVAATAGSLYWAKEYFNGLMVQNLYRNERYEGGSRDAEYAAFLDATKQVLKAQARQAVREHSVRVFHAKQHACLTGELHILANRPTDVEHRTFQGIFDPATTGKNTYPVLARFSNGLGIFQDDKKPDVRGVAFKIIGVHNSQTGADQSVDFSMTNSPVPAGRNLKEFLAFMNDVSRLGATIGTSAFAALHPTAGGDLIRTTGLFNYGILSLATLQYWSGHPYLLGPNQAMKLNLRPEEFSTEDKQTLQSWGGDFLRHDLGNRLRRTNQPLRYVLQVQLEKNAQTTPIENTLQEWTEAASPSIPVAELVFDNQSVDRARQPNKESACDRLTFSPGHYVPEHRPLSNMGRGRIFAYRASSLGRFAHQEDISLEDWKKLRAEGEQGLADEE